MSQELCILNQDVKRKLIVERLADEQKLDFEQRTEITKELSE
jgi:hypothetical protein